MNFPEGGLISNDLRKGGSGEQFVSLWCSWSLSFWNRTPLTCPGLETLFRYGLIAGPFAAGKLIPAHGRGRWILKSNSHRRIRQLP
jgi:hypothetical protein